MDPLSLVNPLQGTYSHFGLSTGNTLPIVARPFGMNHWSMQTAEGGWYFNPAQRKLQGIRCTHQPSPWIGDYGHFVIMPETGPVRRLSPDKRASAFRLDKTELSPAGFTTELIGDGTILEFAPTERGAIFRIQFPEGVPARVILEPCAGESHVTVLDHKTYTGWTRGNSGGVPDGFALYYAVRFEQDVELAELFSGDGMAAVHELTGKRAGLCAEWKHAPGTVTLRVATSFISTDQAMLNLEQELAGRTLEEVKAEGEAIWREQLGRIEIEGGTEDQRKTFYSCLYRTQLFPRIFHETNAAGETVHYSPYDGKVHPGVLYTDNGFWDTYRTEYPLLALLDKKRLADILQGWVNAYKEGGWFPQWASPGYRACMVGTHIDAVIADAVARGITDFDVEAAFEGMLKHAYEVGDAEGAYGRIGIEDYKSLGYVSNTHHESVARSLDYAYDDFCIAQVAKHLGRTAEAEALLERSKSYRNLYDPSVGFMRARNADGSWQQPWSEFQWGSPYVEGGPWQSTWAVQHDIEGLIELMGGREAFIAKLDQMLTMPPRFEVGHYGFEIHEITEMAVADFGQYAHSNQPVHHVLYLYAAAGAPEKAEHYVHRVLNELYSPTHLPGDEDNGEMSAWYVLSSLGLFPLTPGTPEWIRIKPLWDKATIRSADGTVTSL